MCHSSAQAFLLSSEIRCLIQTLIEKYLKKKKKKNNQKTKQNKKNNITSQNAAQPHRVANYRSGGEKNLVMALSDLPLISSFKVHRLIQHELYFLIHATVFAIQGKLCWPFSKLQERVRVCVLHVWLCTSLLPKKSVNINYMQCTKPSAESDSLSVHSWVLLLHTWITWSLTMSKRKLVSYLTDPCREDVSLV